LFFVRFVIEREAEKYGSSSIYVIMSYLRFVSAFACRVCGQGLYVTGVRLSVRLSVCPVVRQSLLRRAAGLLFSASRAQCIDRQRRAPAPSSSGAAARRSAANAGSVMLTAELTRLDTDLLYSVFAAETSKTAEILNRPINYLQ